VSFCVSINILERKNKRKKPEGKRRNWRKKETEEMKEMKNSNRFELLEEFNPLQKYIA